MLYRGFRTLAWIVIAAVFISGLVGGVHRALNDQPDWRDFTRESQYAWDNESIRLGTSMFGYLPSTVFALWPFTVWLPHPAGAFVFVFVNAIVTVVVCGLLYRWWRSKTPGGGRVLQGADFVWPLWLCFAHVQHVLQANQLTLWVVLACVAGLFLLMNGRDWSAGVAFGLGICVKVTPLFFLGFLLLRRKWKASAAVILTVVVFDFIPSVLFFGVDGAVQEHRNWMKRVEWYSNARLIEDPYLRIRRHGHNCSYSVVLGRWLRPPPTGTTQVILHGEPPPDVIENTRETLKADEVLVLDPMPHADTAWRLRRDAIPDLPRFRIAHLSADAVRWIWGTTVLLIMGWLFMGTHRDRSPPAGGDTILADGALWMLVMLVPAPMMRDYYLPFALPACAVVCRTLLVGHGQRTGRSVAFACLVFFYASTLGLNWEAGNFYGLHLLTVLGLAVCCAWCRRALAAAAISPQNAEHA